MTEITYKIIGGDGVEYGPAGEDEIREWIRDGRVGEHSQIWRSDREVWRPAGSYVEFQGELEPLAPPSPPPAAPVGFWARLGAYFLDSLILSLLLSFTIPSQDDSVKQFLTWSQQHPGQINPQLTSRVGFTLLRNAGVRIGVFMLYFVLLNGRFGATVGKLAIGARIVREDGEPLGYGRALLRFVASALSWLTLGFGFVMIGIREDKRGLHDLLARTKVIYRR